MHETVSTNNSVRIAYICKFHLVVSKILRICLPDKHFGTHEGQKMLNDIIVLSMVYITNIIMLTILYGSMLIQYAIKHFFFL